MVFHSSILLSYGINLDTIDLILYYCIPMLPVVTCLYCTTNTYRCQSVRQPVHQNTPLKSIAILAIELGHSVAIIVSKVPSTPGKIHFGSLGNTSTPL